MQAAEKEMSRRIAETEDNEDKMAEVYNAITGDFLTENPEVGFNSALGPGKICKSLYKGMTPAMKQAIFDEQAKQRQELKVDEKKIKYFSYIQLIFFFLNLAKERSA